MNPNEQKMREIAQQVYHENQTSGQFSPVKIPLHVHNGIDNARVNLRNVEFNNKFLTSLFIDAGGGSITLSSGVFNPSSLVFNAIATNGTARAHINGCAELGPCFKTDGVTVLPVNTGILQSSSAVFNTGGTSRVSASGENLGYVVDNTSTTVISINVTSFSNTSISFSSVLVAGWTVTGFLIIT